MTREILHKVIDAIADVNEMNNGYHACCYITQSIGGGILVDVSTHYETKDGIKRGESVTFAESDNEMSKALAMINRMKEEANR